jgi:4-amino-4-deoxy-L-arabinose transferase-like glycosyltransferase
MTPLYTLVLAASYQIAGVSLTTTRLVAAVSGALTCVVLYLFLRSWYPLRRAIVPPLLLALSYFTLSYNRAGFTESFQLLPLTATAGAVVLSTRRPAWAWAAGVFFVLGQLAKPSGAALGLSIAGFWAAHWWLTRRREYSPPFAWQTPIRFTIAAGASVALVVLAMIPEWDSVVHQLGVSLRMAFAGADTGSAEWQRFTLFGWAGFGLVRGALVTQTVVPLVAVLLLLVARLGRAVSRPVDLVELFAWCWLLLGLLFIGFERYQPDRRFLYLMPAIAILASTVLGDGGVPLPSRAGFAGSGGRWRAALAGAVTGGGVLFLLAPLLFPAAADPTRSLLRASLLVSSGTVAGAVLLVLLIPRLPDRAYRIPPLLFLLGFLLLEPLRFGWFLTHPSWTIRDTSRALRQFTADWAPVDRVVFGPAAHTLTLESQLFPLIMRRNERTGARMNLDGWERFHPALALVVVDRSMASMTRDVEAHGLIRCRELPVWPGPAGPRFRIALYLRGDLLERCASFPSTDLPPP